MNSNANKTHCRNKVSTHPVGNLKDIVDDIVGYETVTTRHLERLQHALDSQDQSEECRLLSVRATRHLLATNAAQTAEKGHKVLLCSILVHALWQEAPATGQSQSELEDFFSHEDLQVIYEQLIKMFQLVADSEMLVTVANCNLFIQMIDLPNSETLQKDLFKAVLRGSAEMAVGGEAYSNCLSLCVNFLEEGIDSIQPSLDLILDHLSGFRIVDRDCVTVRFLYALLQQVEDTIGPQLRNIVMKRLKVQSPADKKQKSALLSCSQLNANLVHHLAAAMPSLMDSLVPSSATDMASANEKDALNAFELLHLQISVPSSNAQRHRDLMRHFLATGDNASQHVRLKFVNVLPSYLSLPSPLSHSRIRDLEQTLVARFWDPVPAVRAAAIRSIVSFTAAWAEDKPGRADGSAGILEFHLDVLEKLVLRLMDSVPDVREEVCAQGFSETSEHSQSLVCCCGRCNGTSANMPAAAQCMQALKASLSALSACLHAASSNSDDSDQGPLSGPSALVKRVGAIISKLLHSVSHGANRRLLAQLGEAPGMALIPATGDTNFDAWLLVHLLSDAACSSLLKSLLEWQNNLRVHLSAVLTARKTAAQADQTERVGAQTKVEISVATLVKHWSAAMPKGNLTAGALKHLLEQRDNKLFDGITALCVSPHVAPSFPPVFNQKKRAGAPRGTQRQTQSSQDKHGDSSDDDPADSDVSAVASVASKCAEGVMQDLRQRLRARSKEVLVLVRTAALNILSPAHIQAVLEMVGDIPQETLMLPALPAELQLVQMAMAAIRKAVPMILKGLGNDLLYCAAHDSGLRRCFALILASSGIRIITPVAMMPANQASVLHMLQNVVKEGPPRCAKALPRAALALLPQAVAASVVQKLVEHCMDIMRNGRMDAAAVNAAHVLCEVARDHPSLVAGDLAAIVTWMFDRVLPSGAPEAAAATPGAALTVTLQAAQVTLDDIPMPLHHRTALLAALAKSIAEAGSTASSSVDRAGAAAALAEFVPRALAVMNPDAELSGYEADAPVRRGALRLAAADALLKVGSRLDKELPGQAFVEMALVMQDELAEVRSAFSGVIHGVITNHYKHLAAGSGTQRMSSPDAVAMGKYVSMLSLAVEWTTDFTEPLTKLVFWLQTWNKHAADIPERVEDSRTIEDTGKSHKAGKNDGGRHKSNKTGRTSGSVLSTLPEYSLFFLLYVLSHHDDFPTPEMLTEYSDSLNTKEGTSSGASDPMIPDLLSSFERMLSFQIHALIATSQHPARTLSLIKFFMRVIHQCTEDAEGDTYATQAQQLLADMALKIAVSAVDADTAVAASEMLNPGNCHIPSRLYRRRDGVGQLVRVPSWHVFKGLPDNMSQIITKALGSSNTVAGKGKSARTAAGKGGRQNAARQGGAAKPKSNNAHRAPSRGRSRAAAANDGQGGGGRGDDVVESEDGAQSDDDHGSDFEAGAAEQKRPRSKSAAKQPGVLVPGKSANAARTGGKRPDKSVVAGARKSTKKGGVGKAGHATSTPGRSAQQTLLTPFGAQKVPDVSSPAGKGAKQAQLPVHGDDDSGASAQGGHVSDDEGPAVDQMYDSENQGVQEVAGVGDQSKVSPVLAVRNISHPSDDDTSDSEVALPVKRRKSHSAGPQKIQENTAAPPAQDCDAVSPLDVGDEDESDVGGPLTASVTKSGAKKSRAKKRSSVQLGSGGSPSLSQEQDDGGNVRKRSKGSDVGKSSDGTGGKCGQGKVSALLDLDGTGGVARPVKKNLFQAEAAQGTAAEKVTTMLDSANEMGEMDDGGRCGDDEMCHEAEDIVSADDKRLRSDSAQPRGSGHNAKGLQETSSPSEKENRGFPSQSPGGKHAGVQVTQTADTNTAADRATLQQVVEKQAT